MTTGDLRVEAVGAYAPRYRLTAAAVEETWGQFHGAGISETAVPAADEDALTMASEAATLALSGSDCEADDVTRLLLGTTTPPLEEGAIGARLASVLGCADDLETRTFTAGTRAGTDALATGLGGDGPALVVASDAPRGAPDDEIEHAGGAGAAAVLLTADGGGSVRDRAERTTTAPGTRFRPAGSDETTGLGITAYDRSSFTEAVTTVADALEYDPASADAVALQSPNGTLPYRVAGPLEVDTETIRAGTTVHDLGDTGAASPLLGFASALESGCDSVLLLGYGADGATGLAFGLEAGGVAVSTRLEGDETLSYGEYLRRRGDITPGEPAGGGAYVSVPNWKRTLPQRHRLVAGRCPKCGELAFPPGGACPDCGALEAFDEVALPGTGTVEAATVIGQGGAPPEFVEQQAREGAYVSAVVALDGPDSDGDRATVSTPAQVLTVGDESVSPGDRVEATIRRIYTQEGVTRYGFKMRRLE